MIKIDSERSDPITHSFNNKYGKMKQGILRNDDAGFNDRMISEDYTENNPLTSKRF